MILIAEAMNGAEDQYLKVAIPGLVVLAGCLVWALTRWVLSAPVPPEPWGDQVATEIESDEAPILCHRCLTPHGPLAHFCPDCGAPVGACTNLMPYVNVFSVGHTLRIGTSGEFKRTPVTIIGFVLLSFVEYALFAPVYLFWFFKRLLIPPPSDLPPEDEKVSSPPTVSNG